ncbi:MAG: glycosyltransferase [Lachnospiraceae bacterium]|nr:glycosyltransferase [Lachnospiraceae bacterium]
MSEVKVSIIVPIYNAEDTLQECLDSIAKQTLKEWQVILVDDKSTDNSLSIAKRFEETYEDRTILIPLEENAGPGNARNIALQYATGEYIGFVDSDDAITPHMYELLYEEAIGYTGADGEHYDIVDTGFYDQKNDTAILFTADELTGKLDSKKRSTLIASGGYNCTKIFKRKFLENCHLSFRQEYVLEDMDFLIEAFAKAKSVGNVKQILYLYRDTNSSLSKTVDVEKYYHSTSTAMKAIYDKVSGVQNYPGIRDAVSYAILQLYSYSINVVLSGLKTLYDSKALDSVIRAKEADALEQLEALRTMRKEYASDGYNNIYVNAKISPEDVDIMSRNDECPEKLVEWLKHVGNES